MLRRKTAISIPFHFRNTYKKTWAVKNNFSTKTKYIPWSGQYRYNVMSWNVMSWNTYTNLFFIGSSSYFQLKHKNKKQEKFVTVLWIRVCFLPDPDPTILEITDPDPGSGSWTEKGDNQNFFFFSMWSDVITLLGRT